MNQSKVSHPFVPLGLIRRVPRNGGLVHLAGAVLFADLANFTGLTELLAAKVGADSGESVSHGLNQVLAPAVDAVMSNGGEVVKFSGDGLLCIFIGAEADGPAREAARAIARARVDGPAGEVHRLRCAVVRGIITLARVGGHRGREELIAGGEAVETATRLAALAMAGAEASFASAPAPEPMAPVQVQAEPDADVDVDDAARFLPAYLLARQEDAPARWLQEFRTLTLCFAATGTSDDPATLHASALAVQVIVDREGGQLLRFGLESGQLVAEIAFGLVFGVAATGPREAVRCAAALARDIPGARIGIATGRVMLGPIGSDSRRQLTALGTAVNVAARLMQHAAAGQVLLDQSTRLAAGTRFQAREDEATLKGLGRWAFWRLEPGESAPSEVDEGFYGRAVETDAVRSVLDAPSASAQPPAIVVCGEAGIGKSRFVRWLHDELRARNVHAWVASATPVGRDVPYAALSAVLRDLCGLVPEPDSDVAQRIAEVSRRVLGDAGRAPLLADALRISLPDTPQTAVLVGAARAENIRTALTALFGERSSDGATALIVDDAHWLDASSWSLLQRLASGVAGLRIVVVGRPMLDLEPPPLRWIRDRCALQLQLEPLAPEDIVEVAARQMASAPLPEPVAQWLVERARGNPFFAQELAHMLVATGRVEIREGEFVGVPSSAELDALPSALTIESTLEQRIDRLGVQDALTLKIASVLGSAFSLDAVGDLVTSAGTADAFGLAPRLIASGLVIATGEGAFAFRHRYAQEAAYRMLPGDTRKDLHRRVATRIEHRLGERASECAGELAHHWFASGEVAKSIHWLENAGQQALHNGADREAATHFRRAISIGSDEPAVRQAAWHRQLARSLLGLGQVEGVAQEARQAFELVIRPLPTSASGWLALAAATAMRRLASPLAVRGSGGRTVDEMLEGSRAAGLLAESAYFVNAPEIMIGSALLAVELSERAATAAPISVAYGMLAVVTGMAHLHGTARRHLARAIALAEAADDPMQQGVAWFYAGMYHGCIGDWEPSHAAGRRALAFTEPLGADAQSGAQLTLIAVNALYTSEYGRTRECMSTVGRRAQRSANVQQQGWTCNVLSIADLHQGRYPQAIEHSTQSREIFLNDRDRISLIIADGVQCAALCGSGDIGKALAQAERASLNIAGGRPTTWGQLEGFAGPCEVYASAAWQRTLAPADAWRRAQPAMHGLRLFALIFPFGRARYQWIRALFDLSQNRRGSARGRLHRSIALARRYRMPYEEMRAAQLLASQEDAAEAPSLQARVHELKRIVAAGGASPQPAVQAV